MKKMKPLFMTAMIIIAVSAAFATRPATDCSNEIQYFRICTPWGYYYCPAGELGIDYTCEYSPASTCTWYQPGYFGNDMYQTCQEGQFIPFCMRW